jgi:hypothetical protein
VHKILSLLNLPEGASKDAVKQAHSALRQKLDAKNFATGSKAAIQATTCRSALDKCYKRFDQNKADDEKEISTSGAAEIRPRLGQLCVTSGMISMEQLQEAVEAQVTENLPLGEVLQKKQFISQAELDGLLLGQQIIDVPSACKDPAGIRLVLFDLVTEEMVLIAQMEQKAQSKPIGELMARHGWIDPAVLEALST